MKRAVYPGSFDPVTYGHLDIIQRAASLFDELFIVIMRNPEKLGTFSSEERVEMLEQVIEGIPNVKVIIGEGLTVQMAKELDAGFLVRGIRAVTDYEYELQLATANMMIAPDIDTVFFITRPENSFLSSSTAKSIAENNGDISKFIPKVIQKQVLSKLQKK